MKDKKWNKKLLLLLIVNLVLLASFMIVSLTTGHSVANLYSQQAAGRWGKDKEPYAQVSAFISPEEGKQQEDINNIRSAIMETLSNDSYDLRQENVRVWIDGYSGECEAMVRKDSNTLNVTAVGVGGDFFQFHPFRLLSGNYIAESDLNHDRIVIDQGLAWALFGSNDVVGMQIWMGDTICVVAGVVETEEDSLAQTAYGSSNRIYMLYDQLKRQQENLKITCYEAVLPNPISNYASNTLKNACGLEDDEDISQKQENPLSFENIEILENTNRYRTMTLFDHLKTMKYQSMRTNSIAYPFWENQARVVEHQQMTWLIVKIMLLILPCISLIWLLSHLWVHRSWTTKDLILWLIGKIREKQAKFDEIEPEEEDAEGEYDLEGEEEAGEEYDFEEEEEVGEEYDFDEEYDLEEDIDPDEKRTDDWNDREDYIEISIDADSVDE